MTRFVLVALALLLPAVLSAQDSRRRIDAELNGSLVFGNTEQMLISMRTGIERRDSTVALRTEARFNYGESSTEDEPRSVHRRSWLGSINLDYRPFAAQVPFLLATVESSLEKRIDIRYSGGAGHKMNLVRTDRSTVDMSVALLAERTITHATTAAPAAGAETLARWSARFRAQHDFTENVTFRSETFYRPAVAELGSFTFSSTTSLGYRMNRFLQLRFSFQDHYDSEARTRGARTNNDGELLVGILTEF
ncbi:MAG TPA: DUF481 domain-containing protein [Gemmatimonadaceae bacterium]|nr:DUF481 domain-containing protein [Gemmatimonadaceae bacterium]